MAIGGASNYGFLFNSTGSNNNAGLANALFGSKNTMLSDYSMIKSGAYKKLLTAYYKSQDSDSTTKAADTKKTNTTDSTKTSSTAKSTAKTKEEDNPNLVAKSAADNLKTSAAALQNRDLYKSTGTDEDGNAVYKREDITKAVKSFVSDYNTAISSANKTNSATVQKKASDLVKATQANSRLLKDIGITVNADNQLEIDEDKLSKADVTKLTSLFQGSGSYADRSATIASNVSKAAYTAANSASSYTQKGSYQSAGISSLLDQYM